MNAGFITTITHSLLDAVTVPGNYQSGNLIIVKSPFGTRTVEMIIPPGVKGGGKFVVSLPPPSVKVAPAESPSFKHAVENMMAPTPVVVGQIAEEEESEQ